MAARTLERKNNNKVVSFSALLFMFTLTWITEEELQRVIENKGDEFRRKKNMEIQSRDEKMRNARERFPYNPIKTLCMQQSHTISQQFYKKRVLACMHNECMGLYGSLTKMFFVFKYNLPELRF